MHCHTMITLHDVPIGTGCDCEFIYLTQLKGRLTYAIVLLPGGRTGYEHISILYSTFGVLNLVR